MKRKNDQKNRDILPAVKNPVPSTVAFVGMWKDREDMKDPVAYIRNLRRPRYVWDEASGSVIRSKPSRFIQS